MNRNLTLPELPCHTLVTIFIPPSPTMDTPCHFFLHRNARAEVALDAPWPGTPISGDPHTVTLNGYESEDGKRLMGIWESSPGVWKVDYKDWEYCHFLEGRCILTPEGGKPIELKAGDVFVIEPGFKATWEVVERVRKYYVFVLS
jgi:uncharacterized protein